MLHSLFRLIGEAALAVVKGVTKKIDVMKIEVRVSEFFY